jgi:predicted RNase H-like nuclease (RuvC/YqgF family)
LDPTLQLILTFVGGGGFASLIALWVNRRNRNAEAQKIEAEVTKTDADAANVYFGHNQTLLAEVREMMAEVRMMNKNLADCERHTREQDAEIDHQARTIKVLRDEVVEKENKIADLYQRLNQ